MIRPIALALAIAAPALVPANAQDGVTTEADGTRTLVTETLVPASPQSLWQATTTAQGWKRWAVPSAWLSPADPELLETSYDPAAKPGGAGNIQQRFVARLPGRLLVFRTVKTPDGFPHAQAYKGVTNFLEFIPEGSATRVRLTAVNYPAGKEGDELLGFFKTGNRATLDHLAKVMALEPLDFLVGHCWQGTLPNGDGDVHCFKATGGKVIDHHDVTRAGKVIYGGDTEYSWDGTRIVWTYKDVTGGVMPGTAAAAPDGLDFGSNTYEGKDGRKITIATHWVRIGDTAYEARDTSPDNSHFNRTTRYTRVD